MNQQNDDKENVSATPDDQFSSSPMEKQTVQKNCSASPSSFPKRYILLLMIFIGFVNIYAMRVNLNVALVAMVNNQTIVRRGVKIVKVTSFVIERFSIECPKTKTKEITTANQNKGKYQKEPMRTQSKRM